MIRDADIWASLPVPAVLIAPDDTILDINSAAEGFLNISAKSVRGTRLWDQIVIDAPLEQSFARARENSVLCRLPLCWALKGR